MADVLVCDDIKYVRSSIKNVLEKKHHTVYEASDGAEAMNILEKKEIDLLILDVVMANMGGVEALMKIQDLKRTMKIIIITGQVPSESDAFRNLVKQYGADQILYKPFRKEELLDCVNQLLD